MTRRSPIHAALAALLLASQLAAQDVETQRPWTLMIYAAADNNADGPVLEFLDRIRVALDDDPGMEIVLFIDRSRGHSNNATTLGADFTGARVFRVRKDSAERLDASAHIEGVAAEGDPEVDSADPAVLGGFIAFCKARFPARRYGLMIYGHADGIAMCPDEETKTEMGISQLTRTVGKEGSVDFLALELCHMAGLEIAYQWRPGNGGFSAETLVAIPNAGIPLDWDRAFARIRSKGHAPRGAGKPVRPETMTAADFGRLVIEEGAAGRQALLKRMLAAGRLDLEKPEHLDHVKEAAGSFDLTRAAACKQAVDRLAVALAAGDQKKAFVALRGSRDASPIMHYARRTSFAGRPYIDAYELVRLIADGEDFDAPTRKAAAAARDAIDALVVASFGMEAAFPGFEPGRHGLFIVAPTSWERFGWYSPLKDAEVEFRGLWSFLADGAIPGNGKVENWFELLDAWFDDTTAGKAGTNGYAY